MQPAHTLNLQIENDEETNERFQLADDLLYYSTFASVATRLFTYKIIDGRPREASTVIPSGKRPNCFCFSQSPYI